METPELRARLVHFQSCLEVCAQVFKSVVQFSCTPGRKKEAEVGGSNRSSVADRGLCIYKGQYKQEMQAR